METGNPYASTSAYFETPVLQQQYLGVMVNRPIPKLIDDLTLIINETYNLRPDLLAYDLYGDANLWWVFSQRNPNQLQDPLGDFVTGTTIYLPQESTLKSVGIEGRQNVIKKFNVEKMCFSTYSEYKKLFD